MIFVICLQNYAIFDGFRMNSSMYTAYANEHEVLLSDGTPVFVLAVNEYSGLKSSLGIDNLTVIQLFCAY